MNLPNQEAIRRKIVNPVSLFVHETGLSFAGIMTDASGEYDPQSIRPMIYDETRNEIGVNYAKMLAEAGYQGIMSSIPGGNGTHAKILADLLNQETIVDSRTGETRPMVARYVLGTTDKALRKQYYDQFERGEIDWLAFIDVIREGWDSDKAKAIINMRPTRSALLATQRLGRIGRTDPDAPISVSIDLYDSIMGEDDLDRLPAVLSSDVFEVDQVEQGYTVGAAEEMRCHQS
ncbi:MAG: helicase-related protein [Candidatus Saccharibacteria bacterium]